MPPAITLLAAALPTAILETLLTHLAGLELGAGVGVNVVSPEQAAAELREA